LISGFPIPFYSLGIVLFNSITIIITTSEVELRPRVALISGFPIPFYSLSIVLFNSIAIIITISEVVLP
jgi:hypothetical protein